jgi:23S rRNA pseudouridine2605 synthase
MEVRLQKVIADSGLASRRKAEEFIVQGRVTVNGQVVCELGTKVNPAKDHVKVDGRHLKPVPPQTFVMLHKPKNIVSTMSDPSGRSTIADLLPGVHVRVFPVGRLDFDSEGLVLLTNDGDLAQLLLHPRHHVPKTYLIKVKGMLAPEHIDALQKGVMLDDGRTGPAVVKKVGKATENSWLEITIFEGRKHQVKRMLDAVNHPVLKLKRVKFGPLVLGDLPTGHYRYLTDREANAVRELARERQEVQAGGGQAQAKQVRAKQARAKWAKNARSSRRRWNTSSKRVPA